MIVQGWWWAWWGGRGGCTQARWCRTRHLLQITIFIDRAAGGRGPEEPRHPRRRRTKLLGAARPRWLLGSRRVWLSLRLGGPAAPHTLQQHHTEATGAWPPPAPRHLPPRSAGPSAPPPRPSITTAGMRAPPCDAHTGRHHASTQDAAPPHQHKGTHATHNTYHGRNSGRRRRRHPTQRAVALRGQQPPAACTGCEAERRRW